MVGSSVFMCVNCVTVNAPPEDLMFRTHCSLHSIIYCVNVNTLHTSLGQNWWGLSFIQVKLPGCGNFTSVLLGRNISLLIHSFSSLRKVGKRSGLYPPGWCHFSPQLFQCFLPPWTNLLFILLFRCRALNIHHYTELFTLYCSSCLLWLVSCEHHIPDAV